MLYENPSTNEALKVVLEETYPELKESEDERIRKALIKLNKVPRREIFEAQGITKEQAIAWLEKQKEQNLIMAKSPQLKEQKPAECEPHNWPADKDNLIQKPVEWSEEDNKTRKNLMSLLANLRADRIKEDTYQKYYSWLKSLRHQPKPSTLPVVRTKEIDEQMFDDIIARFDGRHYKYEMLQAMKSWLIELRERLRWKPSQEQMGALKNAQYMMNQSGDYYDTTAIIDSLITDLQKLL